MNYTRLTDKRLAIPKNAFRQSKSKEEYIELSRVAYKTDNTEIYNRLAELEDKIEQGTLIELPCKVGDTVYLPWLYGGVCAMAYLTVTHIILDTEKSYIKTNFETDIEDYYEEYKGGKYDFNDFGKIIFTNKAEAEKRLKELQNE